MLLMSLLFFFKQKTAYEMRISDWSSDVCSSDLIERDALARVRGVDRSTANLHGAHAHRATRRPQLEAIAGRDRCAAQRAGDDRAVAGNAECTIDRQEIGRAHV